MREIKFRVWRSNLGGMFYLDKHGMMTNNSDQISLFNFLEEAEEENKFLGLIWMQYTGLKDKNGKEVYEGDIVISGDNGKYITEVSWNERFASFCLDRKGWLQSHFFGEAVEAGDCEIIGNIYENPELLEVV